MIVLRTFIAKPVFRLFIGTDMCYAVTRGRERERERERELNKNSSVQSCQVGNEGRVIHLVSSIIHSDERERERGRQGEDNLKLPLRLYRLRVPT